MDPKCVWTSSNFLRKKKDQAKGEQGKKKKVDNAFVLLTITTIVSLWVALTKMLIE